MAIGGLVDAEWVDSIFLDIGLITLKGPSNLWENSIYYHSHEMTTKEKELNRDGNWKTRRFSKVLLKLPGVYFVLFTGNRISISINKKTKPKQFEAVREIALKTIAELNLR